MIKGLTLSQAQCRPASGEDQACETRYRIAENLLFHNHNAGHWREGLQHGHGVCEYTGGLRFEGSWQGGVRCGRGCLTAAGYKYDGEWRVDRQHGQGAQ